MLLVGRRIVCMNWDMIPGLDMYGTDPAQHLMTAGQDIGDLLIVIYLFIASSSAVRTYGMIAVLYV